MNKTILIGMTAIAFSLGACGRKVPPTNPLPPTTDTADSGTAVDPNADVDLVELPAMQADLVAKAGSDTVYFGTDEHLLDDAARSTLAAQARWMLANPAVRASIEGHADERGTREYNTALGERRANAARDYLVTQGVPAARLLVVSWGKERPLAIGSTEQAWAQNRRVVTVVVR